MSSSFSLGQFGRSNSTNAAVDEITTILLIFDQKWYPLVPGSYPMNVISSDFDASLLARLSLGMKTYT